MNSTLGKTTMLQNSNTFSSFLGDSSEKAKPFYGETVGIDISLVEEIEDCGVLELHIPGSNSVVSYPKPNHEPATITVHNLPVEAINEAVDELTSHGVQFERYDDETLEVRNLHNLFVS